MSFLRPVSVGQLHLGLAILRVVTGLVFMAHGGQKLFVFGLDGVTGGFAGMGLPLPGVLGPLVALGELLGGFALVVGLLTRVASFGLAIIMLGAVLIVHAKNGFFAPEGFEFPLTLLAALLAFTVAGPGAYALDGVIVSRRSTSRTR
ncbi:MAG TPA: DoxX family protein [Gemmatimonadaceae bacterium]|nr:DoxX family protein [Gemmatimonadaceae bacterium]